MAERFVVTGCGRSGTKYLAELLTAAGVPCGHELAFNADGANLWREDQVADSSWMAATMLDQVSVPVVLLVRHPLAVVRSWVEIGFFSPHDAANRTHEPLIQFAPWVYQFQQPADRALAMWTSLTRAALGRAEMVLRLEELDVNRFGRLLKWAARWRNPRTAASAFEQVEPCNQHRNMRELTGIRHEPSWDNHRRDFGLAQEARHLARSLGYDPEVIPGG